MKRRSLIILLSICAVVSLIITCYVIWWYNDTHTGSRSGKVIDAITGKPIEGAVVKYSWEFGVFMGHAIGGDSYGTREVLTDNKGQYYVPGIYQPKRFIFIDGGFIVDRLLVYKDGYAVYITVPRDEEGKGIVGTSFGYNDNQKYSKRGNVVKLRPFKEGASHEKHIDVIEGYTSGFGGTELIVKELEKERETVNQEAIERRNKENERKQ